MRALIVEDESRIARNLQRALETIPSFAADILGDGLEAWERLLSAAFIRSPEYGTRCSTVIKVGIDRDGNHATSFDEQSWLPIGIAGVRRRYYFRQK